MDVEDFEPSDKLDEKLAILNGNVKKSGGKRKGAGRKRKDGKEPIKRKATPKLVPKADESPRLVHTAESLVGSAIAQGKGYPTKREVLLDVAEKLSQEGFDPAQNMIDMCRNPEAYGLEGKDLIKINSEFMAYLHGKKKSIEKKESKEFTINIIKKDFTIDDTGNVVDI